MLNFVKQLRLIVDNFISENVPENIKHDFIIAAIHFNINLNACSKYDLMRIDHKVKELANLEKNKILTTASIYCYILYKAIKDGKVPKENIVDLQVELMEISTSITDYFTYRIDEDTLNIKLREKLTNLGVN